MEERTAAYVKDLKKLIAEPESALTRCTAMSMKVITEDKQVIVSMKLSINSFRNWEQKMETHALQLHDGRRFSVSIKILKTLFRNSTTRRITESIFPDENSEINCLGYGSK